MHRPRSSRALALLLAATLTGCASSTLIRSTPSGATVYIAGKQVGTTPLRHTDSRRSFEGVHLRLEKEGYEPVETFIRRDGTINIHTLFLAVFIAPLFHIYGYEPQYDYVLKPAGNEDDDLFKDTPRRNDGTDDLY